MELKDFKKEIQEKDYDKVYDIIVQKDIELIKKISKIKNIDITMGKYGSQDLGAELYHYYAIFREESGMFKYIQYVIFKLDKYFYEPLDEYDTPLQRIESYINDYNNLQKLIDTYEEERENLKGKSIIDIRNDYRDKYTELFKEMLDYKKKTYPKNITFNELLEKVYISYYYFAEEFENIERAIEEGYIQDDSYDEEYYINKDDDPVEIVHYLSMTYKNIKDNDYYKSVANFYHEFELKDGETYEDLYKREKNKIKDIFKEMLDYKKVSYNDKDTYNSLFNKVEETYPYLKDVLYGLYSNYNDKSYITILDRMVNIEETLLRRYKNYDKEMIEYQKSQQEKIEENDI